MENNKQKDRSLFFAVCAVVWTVNVIVDLLCKNRKDRSAKLALDSIFLVTWVSAYCQNEKKRKLTNSDSE